ncbi:LOW QUALITY PROTEIN: aryl hydrocarbon receptor repressor [Pyxicephalus adspersus]|uniref:LOW QUALITY PROTEIN: aryl hydrocarbon receptor repressor n=1 Tax=Pyxicephalus adspersus TaxID=30357 RepID=UPI003B5C1DF5
MIPPGECMYAGRKRRKPVQKQQPPSGSKKSNPSKRHRDRLNAELDRLASLLPFSSEIISKLDKLSILRLSVSYLRVKSFFQAIEEEHLKQKPNCLQIGQAIMEHNLSRRIAIPEGELLLESLNGFAIVVNTEGMIFYASSSILNYLGFHQTDVMHQNVYDYIHVDDRQEFCRQLHWAMNPQQMEYLHESQTETGEEMFILNLLKSQESSTLEFSSFLNRCFICRVRCLLDSTSGFLTMQFEGRLKFLFGQKKKTSTGKNVLPQMALFCIAVPLLLPPVSEMKMKSLPVRTQKKLSVPFNTGNTANSLYHHQSTSEVKVIGQNDHQGTSLPKMLSSKENHTQLMNTGDRGIALLKLRANDDQWVLVETNTSSMYRNKYSDYVVPQQASRDDDAYTVKKENIPSLKENMELILCNSPTEFPAHFSHSSLGNHEKDDIKIKFYPTKSDSFTEEEALFSKPFSNMQNHINANGKWTIKNSLRSRSNHHLIGSFPSRMARPFYFMNQNNLVYQRNIEDFQLNCSLQQHSGDNYTGGNIKMENTLIGQDILYNSELSLNIPIKTEHESEIRFKANPDHSAQNWLEESSVLKMTLLDLPKGLHLKTDFHLGEQIPCLKPKNHIHPYCRRCCFLSDANMNHFNTCQSFKGIYNKESTQFYPQTCANLNCTLSQIPGCLNSPNNSANVTKTQEDQQYNLHCEYKTHNLLQNIKREPLDSSAWIENDLETIPENYLKNTLMGFYNSIM